MTTWKNRIVGYGELNPTEILLHPLNLRAHPKCQLDAIGDMLGNIGFLQNVIVNKTTGYLLDGHARVELARDQGQLFVPVTFVELTPEEERAVLALYDQVGAMAELHVERARELLSQVEAPTEALQGVLFEMAKPFKAEGPKGAELQEGTEQAAASDGQQVRMIQLFYGSDEYNDVMKEYNALRTDELNNVSLLVKELVHRAYLSYLQATQ